MLTQVDAAVYHRGPPDFPTEPSAETFSPVWLVISVVFQPQVAVVN